MKRIHCEYCGSDALEEVENGIYLCKYCNTRWEKCAVDDVMKRLADFLDDVKQEKLANARRNLYDAVHSKHLDNAKILRCVQRVQELYPEDFYADFYEKASGSDISSLNNYLNELDVDKERRYLDGVLEYMLRVLVSDSILSVGYLIERAYPKSSTEYQSFQTRFEDIIKEIENGLYDLDITRDVFVVYKSEDMPKVIKLVEYLEKNKLKCFFALRNLRHGRDAVRLYDEHLKIAMDNCQIVVLVSSFKSRTEGDGRRKELSYVREQDFKNAPVYYRVRKKYGEIPINFKKPRIEYLIDDYRGLESEKFVKEFFDGFTHRSTLQEVYNDIYEIQNNQSIDFEQETFEAANFKEVKYCLKCGTENSAKTKYCSECGNNEFVDDLEIYLRAKIEKEYEDKLKRQREELEEKYKQQQDVVVEQKAKGNFEQRGTISSAELNGLKCENCSGNLFTEEKDGMLCCAYCKHIVPDPRKQEIIEPESVDEEDDIEGCYNKGKECFDNEDYAEAVRLFTIAATHGHSSAQNELGFCCENGYGVPKDINEAVKWYRIAAERGNSAAQYNLGASYENGDGVPVDIDEALKWYRKAAEQGDEDAQDAIERIEKHLLEENKNRRVKEEAECKVKENGSGNDALKQLLDTMAKQDELRSNAKILEDIVSQILKTKVTVGKVLCGSQFTRYELEVPPGTPVKVLESFVADISYELATVDSVRVYAPIPGKDAVGIEVPNKMKESPIEDFEIENGILVKYTGKGGVVAIPNSVTSIGDFAFFECRNLTSVSIHNGVTNIGNRAFCNCEALEKVDMPNTVVNIGEGAFHSCESLKNIKISNNVVSIGDYAFCGCYSLSAIEIPSSLISIGEAAFLTDGSLESITVQSGNRKYHSDGNCLIETASKTLILGCKNSIIPSDGSVTVIRDGAFLNCGSLMSIAIPDAVDTIGFGVFSGCSSLHTIYCYASRQPNRWHDFWLVNCDANIVWLGEFKGPIAYPRGSRTYAQTVKKDRCKIESSQIDDGVGDEIDSLLSRIMAYAIRAKQISTSVIQRKFSIGYAQAERIINTMESLGFIGSARGNNKPRDVFMTVEQYKEVFGHDVI